MTSDHHWTVSKGPLPELSGSTAFERRQELSDLFAQVVEVEYGGLPPEPQSVRIENVSQSRLSLWPNTPMLWSYRIHCEGGDKPFSFMAQLHFPQGEGPFPVIINADGCWKYMTEKVAQTILAHGCAILTFNRCEMARDLGGSAQANEGWDAREAGLYDIYPGGHFGAISAWAWGVHRAVDLVMTLPFIDHAHIAVSGHSRGGKTVLLAGVTDERITLINDNASGTCGSAPSRLVEGKGESLEKILHQFPHWFGPELLQYSGKEEALPFDQHHLLAALAPRPVLLTYAKGDLWSNPPGMQLCVEAAKEMYVLNGNPDDLTYHLREGGHAHTLEDWQALLRFAAKYGFGKAPG